MARLGSTSLNRDALHTGAYALTGKFGDYRTLSDAKIDPQLRIFEVGFDQNIADAGAISLGGIKSFTNFEVLGIVAFRDDAIDLAESLNASLSSISPNNKIRRISKEVLYKTLAAKNVAVPRHAVIDNIDSLSALTTETFGDTPVVIKPSFGSSGVGVMKVPNLRNTSDAIERYKLFAPDHSGKPLVVTEFVKPNTGENLRELCVDGIIRGGKVIFSAIHQKLILRDEFPFRDYQMVCPPTNIPSGSFLDVNLRQTAVDAVLALGLTDTVFHCELRVRGEEALVIDLAALPGGGFITHSILHCYGVDLRLAHFMARLGRLDEFSVSSIGPNKHSCIGVMFAGDNTDLSPRGIQTMIEVTSRSPVYMMNVRPSILSEDALWRPDVAVSLAVSGESSSQAIANFEKIRQDFSLVQPID